MRSGVLWRGSTGHIAVSGPVVRREELEHVPQAVSVLEEAEQLRQTVLAERERARKDGFAEGLEQGRASAVVQALQVLNDTQYVREQLSEDIVQIISGALDQLLDASVRQAISDSATRRALQQADPTQVAQLLVSPDGLAQAIQLAESQCGSPLPSWLSVRADDSLTAGDVVLVATGKLLDCRLEARLNAWKDTLKGDIVQRLEPVSTDCPGTRADPGTECTEFSGLGHV